MFDLTKQIILTESLQKKYQFARVALHVIFLLVACFVAYRILFPIIPQEFSISNPNSAKNTLVRPRIGQEGEFPKKGLVPNGETLFFNANPLGQFSKASITLTLDENSADMSGSTVKISRSYQAFFYPEGEKMGYKDGTLLTTPSASYYIVSDGLLRKFNNVDTILQLGYPKSSFVLAQENDLVFNKAGADIADSSTYPDDTLFVIDDIYYKLENEILFPFISTRAFLSQFEPIQAISKGADFLAKHAVSETLLGFSDGHLGSSVDSVFILTEGKSYPVADAVTFNTMGLSWEDVVPLSQDELSVYSKQKQFTINEPHPNGTIFTDKETGAYFMIKNGKKLPIPNETILKTYSKRKSVIADLAQAQLEVSCKLEKKFLDSDSYGCQIPLQELTGLFGNSHQLSVTFPTEANLSEIRTTFSTPLSWSSLKNSLSKIKSAVANR